MTKWLDLSALLACKGRFALLGADALSLFGRELFLLLGHDGCSLGVFSCAPDPERENGPGALLRKAQDVHLSLIVNAWHHCGCCGAGVFLMKDDLMHALREVRATYPHIDLADRNTFIANLIFVYQVIVATEALLSEAAPSREFYRAHLTEEKDHAAWLAEDLESAGVNVRAQPVFPEAIAMVGSQYYLIRHVDPVALLGYMAVLECFPGSMAHVEVLERIHGAPLCRTLRHHAEHDIEHGAQVLDEIDELSAREYRLVKQNAIQTALYLRAAIAKFNGGGKCLE